MAITNLTNTKWTFNETVDLNFDSTEWNISFTTAPYEYNGSLYSNNKKITAGIQYQPGTVNVEILRAMTYSYDLGEYTQNNQVYNPNNEQHWTSEDFKTIEITGGSDVENPELIAFLTENATLEGGQEEPEVPEEPEESVDLTNTSWVFKAAPKYAISQTFNIDFTSNNESFTSLVASNWGACVIGYNEPATAYNYNWSDEVYRKITITGGADVKNAELITFLQKNTLPTPEFTEVKVPLKIYEDLTTEEYEVLTKDEDSFYLVDGIGVYKGNKLIAQTSTYPKKMSYNGSDCYISEGGYYQCDFRDKLLNPDNGAIFLINIYGKYGQNRLPILTNTTFEFNDCEVSGWSNGFTVNKLVDGERGSFNGTEFSSFEVIILSEY